MVASVLLAGSQAAPVDSLAVLEASLVEVEVSQVVPASALTLEAAAAEAKDSHFDHPRMKQGMVMTRTKEKSLTSHGHGPQMTMTKVEAKNLACFSSSTNSGEKHASNWWIPFDDMAWPLLRQLCCSRRRLSHWACWRLRLYTCG